MYTFADYPRDPKLIEQLTKTIHVFDDKARHIAPNDLAISRYNQRYLAEHLSRRSSLLKRIAYLLAWVIRDTSKPLRDVIFVEYGAGTGLPCCFAKLLGVGTVIYSGHFEPSCQDARVIHENFGVQADAYVHGELREVTDFLKAHQLGCDAMISSDCIEHIYDIDAFLLSHRDIPGDRLAVAHSSGANTRNPRISRRLRRYQVQREYEGFLVKDGCKPTELSQPYFEVRKQIIKEYASDWDNDILDKLARNTRGLRQDDIVRALEQYKTSGVLPDPPKDPTNTCDPLNGNWAERLLDFALICKRFSEAGFAARILPGYYGGTTPVRRVITPMLNAVMRVAGPAAIYLGHFFTLYGERIPPEKKSF